MIYIRIKENYLIKESQGRNVIWTMRAVRMLIEGTSIGGKETRLILSFLIGA